MHVQILILVARLRQNLIQYRYIFLKILDYEHTFFLEIVGRFDGTSQLTIFILNWTLFKILRRR